jgi:hypothetical protein
MLNSDVMIVLRRSPASPDDETSTTARANPTSDMVSNARRLLVNPCAFGFAAVITVACVSDICDKEPTNVFISSSEGFAPTNAFVILFVTICCWRCTHRADKVLMSTGMNHMSVTIATAASTKNAAPFPVNEMPGSLLTVVVVGAELGVGVVCANADDADAHMSTNAPPQTTVAAPTLRPIRAVALRVVDTQPPESSDITINHFENKSARRLRQRLLLRVDRKQ